ncbi:MAG: hypothetical protein WCV86_02525 [Patescibacteria group bacterium]|jgi:hypothetical protein
MKKGLLTLTLAVSSILIGGVIAVATTSAFAQNSDTAVPAAETSTATTAQDTMPLLSAEERDAIHTQVQERTAEKLGVTVDAMDTARTEARTEVFAEHGIDLAAHQAERLERMTAHLQEMVDEGRITQEEMDARIQQIEDGEGFGPGMGQGMHDGLGHGHRGMGSMDL